MATGTPDRAAVGLERFERAAYAFAGGQFVGGAVLLAVLIFAFGKWDPELGSRFGVMFTATLLLAIFTIPAAIVFAIAALLFCALFYRAEPRRWVAGACGAALPALYFQFLLWPKCDLDTWVVIAAPLGVVSLVAALVGGRFRP